MLKPNIAKVWNNEISVFVSDIHIALSRAILGDLLQMVFNFVVSLVL